MCEEIDPIPRYMLVWVRIILLGALRSVLHLKSSQGDLCVPAPGSSVPRHEGGEGGAHPPHRAADGAPHLPQTPQPGSPCSGLHAPWHGDTPPPCPANGGNGTNKRKGKQQKAGPCQPDHSWGYF